MKDRTSKPDRSNATNLRPAVCEHCGADLKPGSGFVWVCLGPRGECEDPTHIERGGGAHIRCKDARACHGRATKAMGGKRKRRAAPQASRQDAPLTPENATETREEVEAGPQDTGNEPERAQGPSQRSGDEEPSRIEITMHSHADWDRPPTYVGCFIPGAEVRIGMPPLVTREEALTAAGCPRPGEPEGYCGPPLLASCPHKRHQTHETGELERLFTMTGIHEYRCLVCSERFFVWACCGHVSTEPPLPSSVYRDPAFACCPACGENRFAATSR